MARPKSATHDIKRDAILDIAAQSFAEEVITLLEKGLN